MWSQKMYKLQNRDAQSKGLSLAVLVAVALVAMISNDGTNDTAESQGMAATAPPTHHASFRALRQAEALKRADKGIIDVFGVDPILPEAWIYVADSTLDGNGTEYWIFHSSFAPASPGNDKSFSFEYVSGQNPQTLQAALDYIVLNNSHVTNSGELVVHKMVSTLVP